MNTINLDRTVPWNIDLQHQKAIKPLKVETLTLKVVQLTGAGLSSSIRWIIFLCVSYILMVAIFISFNLVDFDFRYRVPGIPALILLATLGLNELINKFCKKPDEFIMAHD